jgi:hypothetical protein
VEVRRSAAATPMAKSRGGAAAANGGSQELSRPTAAQDDVGVPCFISWNDSSAPTPTGASTTPRPQSRKSPRAGRRGSLALIRLAASTDAEELKKEVVRRTPPLSLSGSCSARRRRSRSPPHRRSSWTKRRRPAPLSQGHGRFRLDREAHAGPYASVVRPGVREMKCTSTSPSSENPSAAPGATSIRNWGLPHLSYWSASI